MPSNPQPDDEFVISDLETLRVFADSFRVQIVELLWGAPKTVKQLATELDVPPTKLYYHINLLEKHGLIRVTSTRLVSGIQEKHYQARARAYPVDRALLSAPPGGSSEGLERTLTMGFDDTRDDIRRSVRAGIIDMTSGVERHRRLFFAKSGKRLAPEQALHFYERLHALIEEFDALDTSPHEATQPYRILLAIYPSRYGGTPPPEEEPNEGP